MDRIPHRMRVWQATRLLQQLVPPDVARRPEFAEPRARPSLECPLQCAPVPPARREGREMIYVQGQTPVVVPGGRPREVMGRCLLAW